MLIKQAKNAGEPLPEMIANRPRLNTFENFFYTAFLDLDTERSHGQSLVRIPRSKMLEYADECGMNEFERYRLVSIIREVDIKHLNFLADRRLAEIEAMRK